MVNPVSHVDQLASYALYEELINKAIVRQYQNAESVIRIELGMERIPFDVLTRLQKDFDAAGWEFIYREALPAARLKERVASPGFIELCAKPEMVEFERIAKRALEDEKSGYLSVDETKVLLDKLLETGDRYKKAYIEALDDICMKIMTDSMLEQRSCQRFLKHIENLRNEKLLPSELGIWMRWVWDLLSGRVENR